MVTNCAKFMIITCGLVFIYLSRLCQVNNVCTAYIVKYMVTKIVHVMKKKKKKINVNQTKCQFRQKNLPKNHAKTIKQYRNIYVKLKHVYVFFFLNFVYFPPPAAFDQKDFRFFLYVSFNCNCCCCLLSLLLAIKIYINYSFYLHPFH